MTLSLIHRAPVQDKGSKMLCVQWTAMKIIPSDRLHQEYLTINLGITRDWQKLQLMLVRLCERWRDRIWETVADWVNLSKRGGKDGVFRGADFWCVFLTTTKKVRSGKVVKKNSPIWNIMGEMQGHWSTHSITQSLTESLTQSLSTEKAGAGAVCCQFTFQTLHATSQDGSS